jgi:deazaflavin-dependent oxidoreductase (nitroreductase family)
MGTAETFQRGFLRFHQRVYEATGGRVGHRLIGVPCLLLRTTGRRSGALRTNALVYAVDGRDRVVVASNGGDDRAPGWLHNVRAEPVVEVQVGAGRRHATARVVERGEPDYDRLWALVNANNHGRYDGYQARTTRPIPLVVLTPD